MKPSAPPSVQTQPNSLESEQALLGSLLISSDAVGKVAAFLEPGDFYRERHGVIYDAILSLWKNSEPTDFVKICDLLEQRRTLSEIGGGAYLSELVNATPTAVHAEAYGRTIQRHATFRRLIQAAGKIAAIGYEEHGDVTEAIGQAQALLYDVQRNSRTGKLISPSERATRALVRYSELQETGIAGNGIQYGLADLDALTAGAHPGELIIVAGRPSMGKTALMFNMAEHMSRRNCRVLVATAEQPEWQLTDRSLAARISRSVQGLQEGPFDDALWAAISEHLGQIADESLWVYDDPDMTTTSIRAVATEMRSKVGLDVLVVDYLQLLHDRHGANENERVGRMSRELKATARALNVPLICGSQLNRECESRANKKPQLSDLRESGSIEQDADVVFLLHRDAYYWTESEWLKSHGTKPYPKNLTEVIIAKQRNGPRGKSVNLLFLDTTMQFRDWEYRHAG